MNKHLSIFLLLLFSSISFAAVSPLDCAFDTVTTIRDDAGDIISLVIILMVFLLTAIYTYATVFNKAEYLILVKDEFFHLGISVMMLLFFGVAMTMGCTLISEVFSSAYSQLETPELSDPCNPGAGTATVQSLSSCYIGMMERDGERIIQAYTNANIRLQIEASGYINYFGLMQGSIFAPYAHLRAYAMFIDTLNNMFAVPAYISIKAQSIFIRFFLGDEFGGRSTILEFLLPGAFVLRFFPPTRQAGNMIIAFASGIYLIVPVFVALNGMTYAFIFTEADKLSYSFLANDLVLTGGVYNSGDLALSSTTTLLEVARLYPQAFLLPNLLIVVLVTFISSMNKALKVLT
ncbi:hypothetical protein KJ780_02410 [Candidatus Micrarchaeota archaeon]|nr:hypothetical protein [Candidatus Micrarchaeota archaeon]